MKSVQVCPCGCIHRIADDQTEVICDACKAAFELTVEQFEAGIPKPLKSDFDMTTREGRDLYKQAMRRYVFCDPTAE